MKAVTLPKGKLDSLVMFRTLSPVYTDKISENGKSKGALANFGKLTEEQGNWPLDSPM